MAIYLTNDRPSRRQPRQVIFSQILVLVGVLMALLAGVVADAFGQIRSDFDGPFGAITPGRSTVCGFALNHSGRPLESIRLQVHLLQLPVGQSPRWVQVADLPVVYGHARPDVAAAFGPQYLNSGWCATLDLGPGHYGLWLVSTSGTDYSSDYTYATVGGHIISAITLPTDPVLAPLFTLSGNVIDTHPHANGRFDSGYVYALDLAKPSTGFRQIGHVTFADGGYALGAGPGWSVSGTLPPGLYDIVAEFSVWRPMQERYELHARPVRVRVQ